MSGDKVVLDTNVLIYMSKGLIDEQKLLQLNFNEFCILVEKVSELFANEAINPVIDCEGCKNVVKHYYHF